LTGPPLRKMLQHAVDLLVRFPGNDFLLAICKITSRIAQFSIHEPLGKMLQSLQLLLKSAQEWEQYAARHVSLSDSIKGITALVTRWRTLELKSWANLLRGREIFYVQRARKFWFTLHNVLNTLPETANHHSSASIHTAIPLFGTWKNKIRSVEGIISWLFHGIEDQDDSKVTSGASSTGAAGGPSAHYNKLTDSIHHLKGKQQRKKRRQQEEDESEPEFDEQKYLLDIFESLDGFLRGCVVGEFPVRLHLLRLFCLEKFEVYFLQNQHPERVDYQTILHLKVASICYGVWCYYSQFLPTVRKFQELLKTPLQTRLNDEIKISKWDELNVYAVMEHSERVHRKLTKIIREYETDVLDYPVTAVLQREIMSSMISEHGELKASVEIPSSELMFPHTERPQFRTRTVIFDSKGEEAKEKEEGEEDREEIVDEEKSDDVTSSGEKDEKKVPEIVEVIPGDYIEPEDNCQVIIEKYSSRQKETIPLTSSQLSIFLSSLETTVPVQRLIQTPKLHSKMNQYLSDLLELQPHNDDKDLDSMSRYSQKIRYGLMVSEISENMCADIFYRIETLRSQSAETSNRNVKHRALADLLHRLRDEGISHLRSYSPNQSKSAVDIFSLPSVTPIEYTSHLSHSIFAEKLGLLDKGENYFYRNICEINQLRAQALSPYSTDISAREVQVMLGETESLFFHLLRTRAFISEGLKSISQLLNVTNFLKTFLVSNDNSTGPGVVTPLAGAGVVMTPTTQQIPNQHKVREVCKYIKQAGKILKCSVLELKEMLHTALTCGNESPVDIWSTNTRNISGSDFPKWKAEIVTSTLDRIVTSLDDVLSFNQTTSGHAILSPAVPLTLQSNEMKYSVDFLSSYSKSLTALEMSLGEFMNSAPYFNEVLSPEVISPLKVQLSDYLSQISQHKSFFQSMSQPHSLQRSPESLLSHNTTATTNCDNLLQPLGVVVDDCLITIQNLRTFSNDLTVLSNHKKGYFNEDISLPVVTSPDHGAASGSSSSVAVIPLISCLSLAHKSFSSMKVSIIVHHLTQVQNEINSDSSSSSNENTSVHLLSLLLPVVLPLVDHVLASCVVLIEDLLSAYKSLGKLLYVSLRTFRVLLAKGFCSDQTKDGGEGDGEGNDVSKMTFEDDVEGTGMGEGEGKKDVSDQIENEEQLLGTKDENDKAEQQEKPNKQLNEEEKDKGVEMTQNFDGEMCDLPDEQQKDDDEEEPEEEEELDREMGGELDYENIVDEKQWGDESDEEEDQNPEDEEKFENESKMKGETIDGEMTTNDEKNEDNSPEEKESSEGKKGAKKDDDAGEGEEDESPNDESKARDEDDSMEKPVGVDVKQDEAKSEEEGGEGEDERGEDGNEEEDGFGGDAQEGEEKEQPDDGELPENMELDGGGSGEDDESPGDDQSPENDLDDEMKLPPPDDGEDDKMEQEENNAEVSQSLGGNNNTEGPEQEQEPEVPEEDQELQKLEMNLSEDQKKNSAANIGLKSRQGTDSVVESGEIIEEETDQAQADEDLTEEEQQKAKNNSSGSSSTDGMKSQMKDRQEQKDESSKGGAQSGNESMEGQQTEGDSQQPEKKHSDRRRMEPPNPFRKLGDINKRWEKRLNMDTSPEEEEDSQDQTPPSGDDQKSGTYEFELGKNDNGNDDEAEAEGTQVLAEANEKDAVHLHEKGEQEEEDERMNQEVHDENGAESGGEGEGENLSSKDQTKREKKRDRSAEEGEDSYSDSEEQQRPKKSKYSDGRPEEESEDEVEGVMPEEEEDDEELHGKKENVEDKTDGGRLVNNLESWLPKTQDPALTREVDPGHPEDEEDESMELVEVIQDVSPQLDENRLRKGHEQWSHLTAQYQSSCIRLTEQLRLVLEPTLASRLQGDYRTGKRISMRRVIGYVASGFRKDKIWLRRTKPYKREYQIMVMIDDSRSMGEAGPIALAALNVLAGALTRLEVGHVGVCSFAEHVTCLHHFHQPFNDTAGSRILSQFQFNASQTRLASALQAVLPLFEESKSLSSSSSSSSTSSIAVQICFIISDARIDSENREKLTRIIRELAEKNILAVLVIIDKNEDPKDSIFATKSVEFTSRGLVTKSYLDDFPFPYYVAIQQIDALPEVLAGALKQWFELVRSELDGAH
jgi:midasin